MMVGETDNCRGRIAYVRLLHNKLCCSQNVSLRKKSSKKKVSMYFLLLYSKLLGLQLFLTIGFCLFRREMNE